MCLSTRGGITGNKFEGVSCDDYHLSVPGMGRYSKSHVQRWGLGEGRGFGKGRGRRDSVADLGGIFSISCSFSQNLAKSYVGAPLEGWRPLLRGILDLPLGLDIDKNAE